MSIVKKMAGVGAVVITSAATLMMGIGPAGAALMIGEVDGVQIFQGGALVQAVVDVTCRPGHNMGIGVHIEQALPATAQFPAGEAVGDGRLGFTCTKGDTDIRVNVFYGGPAFQPGPAVCKVNLFDGKTGRFIPDQTLPCRISNRGPLT